MCACKCGLVLGSSLQGCGVGERPCPGDAGSGDEASEGLEVSVRMSEHGCASVCTAHMYLLSCAPAPAARPKQSTVCIRCSLPLLLLLLQPQVLVLLLLWCCCHIYFRQVKSELDAGSMKLREGAVVTLRVRTV